MRRLLASDAPACVAVATSIGWRTTEDRWRMLLGIGEGYGVERDGALVGTVIVNVFGDAIATIAMMLVAEQHRRQKLGMELMERALARAGGATTFLYATELGQRLYERIGFSVAGASLRVEGRPMFAAPHDDGLRAMRPADMPRVCALDGEAHGAPRGRMLEALAASADRALVIEQDGELAGFGVAWVYDGFRTIAPLVARTDGAARALFAALASGSAEPVRADFDPGERVLVAWCGEHGLSVMGPSTLMIRGGGVLPGRRALVRTLAGRAFG